MDWQQLAVIIGVIGGIGTGIGIFCKKVVPAIRKVNHFVDDMIGEAARAGVAARPGLFERLDKIEHELHPNSGKSLRDAVDQQGVKLDAHIAACPPAPTTTINVNGGGQ